MMSDEHPIYLPPCQACGRAVCDQPYYSAALADYAPGGFHACDDRCAAEFVRRVLDRRGTLRLFGTDGRYSQ